MRCLKTLATCLLALALHSTAWAQIYETTDAEGNPDFTDAPATENAEVIDLQQTNVVDALLSKPQDESQANTVETKQAPQQENTTVNVNVGNGNDDYDDGAHDDALALQRAIDRGDRAAPLIASHLP